MNSVQNQKLWILCPANISITSTASKLVRSDIDYITSVKGKAKNTEEAKQRRKTEFELQ